MLYTEKVIDIAYDNWDRYYIWLHKQPLFLWQMALSLKLFGLSEYALRLPNIIMATLLIPITFRMSKLLLNNRVGYLAAVLLISTIYVLELVAGRQVLEHNDMAFVFYVSGSIWAFIEYRHSNNR
ncbi:MAG: glycosyltransferase family 39 protein, partial [Cytophagales bacterium]